MSARFSPFAALGEALRFLTVLPWPGPAATDPASLAHGAAAFPAVGLLIGAFSVGAGVIAERLFGSPIHALAAVAASAAVSGALHLDGLADSADALFSWRPRERKLEILRDSRIGAMGALALFFALALKSSALAGLGPSWWRAALIAPVLGRWSALYGMVCFPPARPDGLGAALRSHVKKRDFVAATVLAIAIVGCASPAPGLLAAALVWVAAHGIARAMTRSLGGMTGDTCGALGEVGELVTLLAFLTLSNRGRIE